MEGIGVGIVKRGKPMPLAKGAGLVYHIRSGGDFMPSEIVRNDINAALFKVDQSMLVA